MTVLLAIISVLGMFATVAWIVLLLFVASVQASDGGGSVAVAGLLAGSLIGLACFAAAAANSSESPGKGVAFLVAGVVLAVGSYAVPELIIYG